jgi:hypothetical protein
MIWTFNTITIDGNEIYRGNDFTLQREFIYAGEYETCTGKRCADIVGWRYGDLTISWDNLPQAQLDYILGLTGLEVEFIFSNEAGVSVTEKVRPSLVSSQASIYTDPFGVKSWRNISLQLQFTEAHN